MVDPISVMKKINRFGSCLLPVILLLTFASVSLAAEGVSGITSALTQLCQTAKSLLLIGTMLMVIMAAVIYSVGQILGAETRARASVWATAMMTGAIIGIVIYVVVPWVLNMINNNVPVSC